MAKITKKTDLLKLVDMKINDLNLIKSALQAKGNFTKVELEEYIGQFYKALDLKGKK